MVRRHIRRMLAGRYVVPTHSRIYECSVFGQRGHPKIYGRHILKSNFLWFWTFPCITVHRYCEIQDHETRPSAVADSQISRRIFVRRKSAEKIPASRNLFCAWKLQICFRIMTDVMMTSDILTIRLIKTVQCWWRLDTTWSWASY